MNLAPYFFDKDHVAKIRCGLSIAVLDKKIHKIIEKVQNFKKTLKKHDVDPGIVNQDGYNAIHIAAMTNSSSALRVILTDSIISNRNWLIGSVSHFLVKKVV